MAAGRDGSLWVAALGGGLLRLADHSAGRVGLERFRTSTRSAGSPRSIFADRQRQPLGRHARRRPAARVGELHSQRPSARGTDQRRRPRRPRYARRFGLGRDRTQPQSFHRRTTRELHVRRRARSTWMIGPALDRGRARIRTVRERTIRPIDFPSDVRWQEIMSVATDAAGAHWFCSSQQGVMAWQDGTLRAFPDQPRRALAVPSSRTDRAARGSVSPRAAWRSTRRARSAISAGQRTRQGQVLQILEDRASSIWIETSRGSAGFRTAASRRHRGNGPFTDLTAALVQDDDGYLWVGVSSGAALVRFRPSEMD